jgi:protein-S-isoprenylcysteine O-methyltransferase Ste14
MWAGLVLRIWAIAVLGKSFRMTVEVDTGQKVVDSGPYRWVRHPSYTGILLLMVGLGLVYGNWPALAILLVLPAGVLIHRILVEEAVLTKVIGRAYTEYAAHTKRLVPGLWLQAVDSAQERRSHRVDGLGHMQPKLHGQIMTKQP